MSDRLRLLQETVTWREVTDADLAVCEAGPGPLPHDDAIFVRNSVKRLFNQSYATRDDEEIAHFIVVIEDYMSKDKYYCLFYGHEFRKVLTYLRRRGETDRAKQLLEKSLLSLHVLRREGDSMSLGHFALGGNYSSSWPVTYFDLYTKLLIKQGEIGTAQALLHEALDAGDLLEDAVVMLKKTLATLDGTKVAAKFPTVSVERAGLATHYLAEPTIEFVALAYLKDKLGREGIVANVDTWRLIPAVIRAELSTDDFATIYAEDAGVAPPASFCDCLAANRDEFACAFAAMAGTVFGGVGFPDLILWNEHNLRDVLFVEVKDVNDRLRPHQEALLNAFVDAGLDCHVLKFLR